MLLVIASPPLGARSAGENTTLPSVMLIAANLVTLPSVVLVPANPRACQTPLDLGWTQEQPPINRVQPLATSVLTTYGPCSSRQLAQKSTIQAILVSLDVHLLLDSGCQKSYISECARELLHLDAIGEQSLSIATFGYNSGSMKVCPIMNVGICLRGYPYVSLPMSCPPFVSLWLDSL